MEIILASTSPRRKTLLNNAGITFSVVSPNYDEKFDNFKFAPEKIEEISLNKALSIKNKVSDNSVILSADTVVVFEDKILLKPKDREDAFQTLKKLGGNEHFVITAYTLFQPKTDKKVTSHVKSVVRFAPLTDRQIWDYIDKFNPLDKAGAYGLQELPDYFKPEVEGSEDNVVGLPVKEILEDLKKFS